MSSLTESQKDDILQSMDHPDQRSWCSGALTLQSDDLPLFYTAGGQSDANDNTNAKRLNLLAATPSELDSLTSACDPATFGANDKNVLDETYRKAGKLDQESFALNFFPERLGFPTIIKKALLTPSGRNIEFEKYKINVYGEGSFFKPHKDTPRSQSMFGSLVIVFPTPHEGGCLMLSHKKRSTTIDFANILKSQPSQAIAFTAFYSDVEHEVSEVISGHRVSLTYNLYYTDDEGNEGESSKIVNVPTNTSYEVAYVKLQTTLSRLLQDSTFLPEGGILCFALKHQYAIPTSAMSPPEFPFKRHKKSGDKPLESLKKFLKGSDAVLCNVCEHFGLTASLKFVYDSELGCNEEEERYYLSDYGLSFDECLAGGPYDGDPHEDLRRGLQEVEEGVNFTLVTNEDETRGHDKGTTFKAPFMAFGNDATLQYIYSDVSLVIYVGPQGKREGFHMGKKTGEREE